MDNWSSFGALSNHVVNRSLMDTSATVNQFWINKCWNFPLLSQLLPSAIVDSICVIPISQADDEDKLIWGAASNGFFSVKSAYSLLFNEQNSSAYSWSNNWSLPIPPKLKIFLWTVMAQKILTNSQRMHRHFTTDPSCFHCPGTPETLLHLFRDCPKAMLVWNAFYIPPSMAASFSLDWNGWIHNNLIQERCFHMSSPWNIFFSFVCWHIWKWRCKCIFDSRFNLPFDMKGIIATYMCEWASASHRSKEIHSRQTVLLHWKKPPEGIIKINVDGSLNSSGCIGAGGIMRDFSGAWKGGFMINLGSGSILLAEIWAVFYGLQLALQHGHQNIKIESDSAIIVQLLTDDDCTVHPLGTIIKNCQSLASNFSSCSFLHIFREQNFAADFLAKASLKCEKGITWLDANPPDMDHLILEDIAGFVRPRSIHTEDPSISSRPPDDQWNAEHPLSTNADTLRMQRQDDLSDDAEVISPAQNAPSNADYSNMNPSSYG